MEEDTIERIRLLKIPLDIVTQEQLPWTILRLLQTKAGGNIVLLSLWDLLKARRNAEYRKFVQEASLVLPISKSLVSGAKFLTGKTPARYMPFNFVVSLLSILEKSEYSLYLLGGSQKVLEKTEKNIRQTFPRIRIVGRHRGRIKKIQEASLIEAIHKAAASILLVAKGVRGGEKWIVRHEGRLNKGFRLWCSDLFEVFADKKRRPNQGIFDSGLECLTYIAKNPLKILRFFPYMYYKILLLIYKIFAKQFEKNAAQS
ncbi:MAG: WecB/TagA/CpsF family glycosyltransferase [Spirochaetaceae bacterium]|jgi:N-acetylglucosaminyldiphosphoundecaprenol N-acetyl-beta-D-mannosaminyltransferase|nr:WecB/TagA/CpsF family glycosyltransferase [Spirochaetaceae bacterium]